MHNKYSKKGTDMLKIETLKQKRISDDPSLMWIDPPGINEDIESFVIPIFEKLDKTYKLTINDISNILKCSRQFVEKNITKNVKHIFLNQRIKKLLINNNKYEYDLNLNGYYFFDYDDFYSFIKQNTIITQQTFVFDLYDYTNNAKELYIVLFEYEKFKSSSVFMKTTERKKELERYESIILSYLNDTGKHLFQNRLLSVLNRNEFPHIIIDEPLPRFFEKGNAFGNNHEQAYRNLFRMGAKKYTIIFGTSKLIRYDADLLEIELPGQFIIPYCEIIK